MFFLRLIENPSSGINKEYEKETAEEAIEHEGIEQDEAIEHENIKQEEAIEHKAIKQEEVIEQEEAIEQEERINEALSISSDRKNTSMSFLFSKRPLNIELSSIHSIHEDITKNTHI